MVDLALPSTREIKRNSAIERMIDALLDAHRTETTMKSARRRHIVRALRAQTMLLDDASSSQGITAPYNEALQGRIAELHRLLDAFGRSAERFSDASIIRRFTPQAPSWEPGTHFNAAEVIRQALRKLGLRDLPSHLAGLARLRQKLRRLGLHLDGFFGHAKVDGRNNP